MIKMHALHAENSRFLRSFKSVLSIRVFET